VALVQISVVGLQMDTEEWDLKDTEVEWDKDLKDTEG